MSTLFPLDLIAAAQSLLTDLQRHALLITTAESCTGGLLAGVLTEVPGASGMVERGFVTYSNASKSELLGVCDDLIARYGAVSEEVAQDAIRLIKVDYEVLPHLATVEQAMRPEAPLVFEKGNTREPSLRQEGDIEAGFKSAAQIVEGLYSTQVQTRATTRSRVRP